MSSIEDTTVRTIAQHVSTLLLAAQKEREGSAMLIKCEKAYKREQELKEKKNKSLSRNIAASKGLLDVWDKQLAATPNTDAVKRSSLEASIKLEKERLSRAEQDQFKWSTGTTVYADKYNEATKRQARYEQARKDAVQNIVSFVQSVSPSVSSIDQTELHMIMERILELRIGWIHSSLCSSLVNDCTLLNSRVQQLLVT
jgi:hypothetical protein